MVTKTREAKTPAVKTPAKRYEITQMVILSAYSKTFSSGKGGFFGQAMNPANGRKFQIIGAVELAPKAG
ncbi:MAG: hypothetical protein ACYDHZ_00995 [Dehalococcoidia bacterium]